MSAADAELAELLAEEEPANDLAAPGPSILDLDDGVHANVPPETYYRRVFGIARKSALDMVHKAPLLYFEWAHGRLPDEETAALRMGGAIDCALLEPERFGVEWAVAPDVDARTKAGRATRDAWRKEHAGKRWLTHGEGVTVRGVVGGILANRDARGLVELAQGAHQVTVRWRDPATGLICSTREDIRVTYGGGDSVAIVDLKTAADATSWAFGRAAKSYRYHVQASHEIEGASMFSDVRRFVFIVVEKTYPYLSELYELPPNALLEGERARRRDLDTMARCIETEQWPALPAGIQTLEWPRWGEERAST